MWYASGRLPNPILNQVIVDTGPLPAKQRMFKCTVAATVQCALELQHVASDGTTVIKSQIIAVPAYGTISGGPQVEEVTMAVNERIRLIAVAAVTGFVSASIDITL
jgi:hypothetical protein